MTKTIKISAVCFVIAIVFMFSGCTGEGSELGSSADETDTVGQKITQIPDAEIVQFTADKLNYASYEQVDFSVVVRSSEKIESSTIKLSGIRPYHFYYIDASKTISLSEGENRIIFSETTPECTSGCGGVYPGPYTIYAQLFIDELEVSNSTTIINLVNE